MSIEPAQEFYCSAYIQALAKPRFIASQTITNVAINNALSG